MSVVNIFQDQCFRIYVIVVDVESTLWMLQVTV